MNQFCTKIRILDKIMDEIRDFGHMKKCHFE